MSISNSNVVVQLDTFQRFGHKARLKECLHNVVCRRLYSYQLLFDIKILQRRITMLGWHPLKRLLIVGFLTGELCIVDVDKVKSPIRYLDDPHTENGPIALVDHHIPSFDKTVMLTTSLDGWIRKWAFNDSVRFLGTVKTDEADPKFFSINSSPHKQIIVAGDMNGSLSILDKDLNLVSRFKAHRNKIISTDVCKSSSWLLSTASLDHTAKLFDIRNLKTALTVLKHHHGVNVAKFSRTGSNLLMTSDQHSEVRIYSGPQWRLEHSIEHPHRQFQHLTAMRASWHPLQDLVVIGRYPDAKLPSYHESELRSIDVFSARSGLLRAQIYSTACTGLSSIAEFDSTGEFIGVAMGRSILVWKFNGADASGDSKTDLSSGCESGVFSTTEKLKCDKKPKKK